MRAIQEHTIHIQGLKDRVHHFRFDLDKEFFDSSDNEEFIDGKLVAEVEFDKKSSMMVAVVDLNGHVEINCDRCNNPMKYPVNGHLRQIFKVTEREKYSDEEVTAISPQAYELNLTASIYECLVLSLPARKVHEEEDCDPEVIAKLKNQTEQTETGDPRWNALRGLTHQ